MAGMAGIAATGKHNEVGQMLGSIAHRGTTTEIIDTGTVTLGMVAPAHEPLAPGELRNAHIARDAAGSGHFALAEASSGLVLKRDRLGVAPLYYGQTPAGHLCFASEVKGLLAVTRDVHELPPGHTFDGRQLVAHDALEKRPALTDAPQVIARELRRRLELAVKKRTRPEGVGAWLSGGLDSSVLAALAHRHTQPFHTFTAGLPGSPDMQYAQVVADFIHAQHHVLTVQVRDLLAVLPQVIYHLESFDAWLVRSSIMNYLVARMAGEYVAQVFSGEGGDELFAGYAYLKSIDPAGLPDELIDITSRLHNTALQRVDRCAAAHGTRAHVAFLDPDVVDYALQIPVQYKLRDGVEKWILRQAVADCLPDAIVRRPKVKFWEGAGVSDLLAQHAESTISTADFAQERCLANGCQLNSKEELLYYRIFRQHFGEFDDLGWMGRTKGTPVT